MPHSIPWRRWLLATAFFLPVAASAQSGNSTLQANPDPIAHWDIIAECHMVVLPQKLALPLIPDLSDDTKIEAAWTKLQQMIEQNEATLVANLTIRGDSGMRMVAESIKEVRYATEFMPPQLPQTVSEKGGANALKNWPHVGIVPTAFETRNVGATVEMEPKVSEDGQWIHLDIVAQHVRFLEFAKIDAGVLASGEHLSVEQPYFSDVKDTLSMQLRAGQRVLIGVHKVPTEEDKMELFFIKMRTEKVPGVK